jgi:Tol biopolymer transport system component
MNVRKYGGKDHKRSFFMKKSKVLIIGFIGLIITTSFFMSSCALINLFRRTPRAAPVEEVIDVANFTNSAMLLGTVRITDDGLPKMSPVVSPDGSRLMYCETSMVRDATTGQNVMQSNIILLRNINTAAKTPLITTGNAFSPGWYDDNTRFLFSFAENNTSRIVRSSSAGGGRTNITRNPVGQRDDQPTIRNGVILFTTQEGGRWVLYSMHENGSNVTRLGEGLDPDWHPDGHKFIYVKGNPTSIWEMDLRTMQETELYPMPRFNIRMPKYTHDGRHIVFQRRSEQVVAGTQVTTSAIGLTQTRTTGTETRWQLFAITAGGYNETALTEGNVDCMFPTLDKNNNLFFISNASGVRRNVTEIYRARLNLE